MTEGLRRLELRRLATRPEHRDAGVAERVGDPDRERSLGPDHDQLGGHRTGRLHDGRGIEGVDPGHRTDPRFAGDRPGSRSHEDFVDARFPGELPGEGVLAPARADDEDARRRDEVHGSATPPRCRIGRQARSIVWVRSGPTDTSTIGTPAISSRALR